MSTDRPSPSTPAPTVTVVSPCPHTPACPPPACLPQSLRSATSTSRANFEARPDRPSDGPSALPGYDAQNDTIATFGGTMAITGDGVNQVKDRTPRFEGWNLVPLAGVPIVGLPFVDRFNTISDTWRDSAGILHNVLKADSEKIFIAARNYREAERRGGSD